MRKQVNYNDAAQEDQGGHWEETGRHWEGLEGTERELGGTGKHWGGADAQAVKSKQVSYNDGAQVGTGRHWEDAGMYWELVGGV